MKILSGRNVNDIYRQGRSLLATDGELQRNQRTGLDVLVVPCPVMSVYDRPTERVLFCHARDASPFFHAFEGIWMLSGSADGRCLDAFVKGFSARYTEKWGGIHGAYGARWRRHFDADQLTIALERLRRDPLDRRVVISMWDPSYDLWSPEQHDEADGDYQEPLDLPCNLLVLPRVVNGRLDITTVSRSHDQVWGAAGANAVHFTMLQEYLAAGLGIPVGKFYQFSNNFHGYVDILDKKPVPVQTTDYYTTDTPNQIVEPSPMVTNFQAFDKDIAVFMEGPTDVRKLPLYENCWFAETLVPMCLTMEAHRAGRRDEALSFAASVVASDWRLAALQWLKRRYEK